MTKIRIDELSFCEAKDIELHNVVGGNDAFFHNDDLFFAEEEPDFYIESTPVTTTTTSSPVITTTTSSTLPVVTEKVVSRDGFFAKARIERGRNSIRSSSVARSF